MARVSRTSAQSTAAPRYCSRPRARTALGPTSTSPSTRLREVHPEKRESWVGNRIDETLHQMRFALGEGVVLAAKWHDPDPGLHPGERRHPVRVQPSAVDHAVRARSSSSPASRETPPPTSLIRSTLRPRPIDTPLASRRRRNTLATAGKVDHPRGRDMEGIDPNRFRLVLRDVGRAQPPQTDQPVGPAPPLQLIEPADLIGTSGDHQLAGPTEWHRLLVAQAPRGDVRLRHTAAPSAIRACSRGRSEALRCCDCSDARRHQALCPRSRPRPREISRQWRVPTPRPISPAPTMQTS